MTASIPFARATAVKDVRRVADVHPLQPGDPRYLDLTRGHGSLAMARLRHHLTALAEDGAGAGENGEFLKLVFSGHRGCGKTTELLRIEQDFARHFYPVHLTLDMSLRTDLDYSLLMLWLVHGLAEQFDRAGMPLSPTLVGAVGHWFATSTDIDIKRVEASGTVGGTLGVGGGIGVLPALGLRLMAQIKSEARGNLERRKEIRSTLQRFAGDLLDNVNSVLTEARAVLRAAGKPSRLLIVQDTLDQLDGDTARTLFIDSGDILKQLQAHVIFTAPVSLTLAPAAISTVFARTFNLPMIKIATKDGNEHRAGLDTLHTLVERRIDLGLFETEDAVAALCRNCGGSVRDLMRLLLRAAENAAIAEKSRIGLDDAERAIADVRVEFQGALRPEHYYFPRLVRIHLTKSDGGHPEDLADGDKAKDTRRCLSELLINGSVLEYNGDDSWFDVHPIVRQLTAFQRALEKARRDGA